MDSTDQGKSSYRLVHLKSGFSPSYICGNLIKSQNYVAFVKNGSLKSRVIIYKVADIEDPSAEPESVKFKTIEWEAKAAECTHINYINLNGCWYLILGFIGSYELYSEDGVKKLHKGQSSDWAMNNLPLQDSAFSSSCTGYHVDENPQNSGQINEYLLMGTTIGEIFQIQITKDSKVIQKQIMATPLGGKQITSLASNKHTGALLAGSSDGNLYQFMISQDDQLELIKHYAQDAQQPVCVNSLQFLPAGPAFDQNAGFFISAFSNGLIKIIDPVQTVMIAELQAHSRSVNYVLCHESNGSFLTVSDDTMVNMWNCQFQKNGDIPILSDIQLRMSQRIPDQILIGAQFGANANSPSVIVAPYDYKFFMHINL